jgi:hypothetical protein
MAITTIDGALAGMIPPRVILKNMTAAEAVGVIMSTFYAPGNPGAAAAPAPGLSGAALTTYDGQIPFNNPISGNSYLGRFAAASSVAGTLVLCDRLWHNSGLVVTTTTAQTINSVAWPARDSEGTTNGADVMVGIEVRTATTNAGAITNMTMSYTDQSGNAGATGTIGSVAPANFPATAVIGTFVPIALAAGDTGVRSIQTFTLGTSLAAGAVHLVAYRELARLELTAANIGNAIDALTSGFVRLYDNTVPFLLWIPTATTAPVITGQLIVTQG